MSQVPRNLDALTTKQLVDLERQVAGEVAKRFERLETAQDSIRSELGAKLSKVLKDMGLPANAASVNIEVKATNGAHKAKGGKSRKPIPVRFRDPGNSANTWTGRGRMPRWMVAATKGTGKSRDDFKIA